MAGENGVVLLDVELDVGQQVVTLEEAVAGGDVEIVLVLGRLLGLRLDQERSLETDLVFVLDHQRDEAAELVEFALHVGVEQRLVTLAPHPTARNSGRRADASPQAPTAPARRRRRTHPDPDWWQPLPCNGGG